MKADALANEDAPFDPTGTSGLQDGESSHGSSERAQSWHGDAASHATEETEVTGMSQALELIDLDGRGRTVLGTSASGQQAQLENLSTAEKLKVLKDMFPNVKDFDITWALEKSGKNFGKTVEQLLNQTWLYEESLNGENHGYRGIEAFTEYTINSRNRKSRKNQKKMLRRTSSTSEEDRPSSTLSPQSRWDQGKEDIDFIVQRTSVPQHHVASAYHQNGASLPFTIAALCASTDPEISTNPNLLPGDSPILDAHAIDLAKDFQRLPYTQIKSLIALAHPSTASAHELARALSSLPKFASTAKLIPQYLRRPPSPPSTAPTPSPIPTLPLPASTAAALAIRRANSSLQAAAANRASKSKPLMSGATAHYNSVRRDADAALHAHATAQADALVTRQSRPGEVDLHGVSVLDAVEIARERVERWWEAEGKEWSREGRVMGGVGGGGLKVVTGVGRHSEGGRGVLGPAVRGMLEREGWRVKSGEGVLVVVGRLRRT